MEDKEKGPARPRWRQKVDEDEVHETENSPKKKTFIKIIVL